VVKGRELWSCLPEQIQRRSGVSVVLSQSRHREFDRSFIWDLSRIVYTQSRIILEMKRSIAAEALKRVDLVSGKIRLGRGTAVAYEGGSAIKVREKEDVAVMSQFRLTMSRFAARNLLEKSMNGRKARCSREDRIGSKVSLGDLKAGSVGRVFCHLWV